jgi:hypothetical protein
MGRKFKSSSDFAEAIAVEPALASVTPGIAATSPWAAYAAGLTVLDSIVANGRSSAKVARRHHRAVKALRKLSLAALGANAVVPPQAAAAIVSAEDEAKAGKRKRQKADKSASGKAEKRSAKKERRGVSAEPVSSEPSGAVQDLAVTA